jgi:hypothetical protein
MIIPMMSPRRGHRLYRRRRAGRRSRRTRSACASATSTRTSASASVLTGETDAYHGNANSLALVEGAEERLVQVGALEGRGSGAAFLVSAARPRLVALLNDSFAILHRDGHLQEMGDRWFGPGRFVPPDNIGIACGMVMSAN